MLAGGSAKRCFVDTALLGVSAWLYPKARLVKLAPLGLQRLARPAASQHDKPDCIGRSPLVGLIQRVRNRGDLHLRKETLASFLTIALDALARVALGSAVRHGSASPARGLDAKEKAIEAQASTRFARMGPLAVVISLWSFSISAVWISATFLVRLRPSPIMSSIARSSRSRHVPKQALPGKWSAI
jgi:hypothetical protein